MKKYFLLSCFLSMSFFSFGQLERTLHQTVDLSEFLNVKIDLHGDYELIHWPGNVFLIESHVKLYDASKHLMDYFIEYGRYEVLTDTIGMNTVLRSKDAERKPLKYKGKECYEEITVKVMAPDFFNITGAKALVNERLQKAGVVSDSVTEEEVNEDEEPEEN